MGREDQDCERVGEEITLGEGRERLRKEEIERHGEGGEKRGGLRRSRKAWGGKKSGRNKSLGDMESVWGG